MLNVNIEIELLLTKAISVTLLNLLVVSVETVKVDELWQKAKHIRSIVVHLCYWTTEQIERHETL